MAKKTRKKTSSRSSTRKHSTNRSSKLSGASITELQAEIQRRTSELEKLEAKREKIVAQLDEIDAEIDQLESLIGVHTTRTISGRRRARRRPKNEMNLVESLAKLLDNKTMSVTEASIEVQRQGYKTTSPSFRTIVNQTLINSGRFKRVGRGLYTTK